MKETYTVDTSRKSIQEKIKKVEELKGEMKKYKTFAVIELRNLPDDLLQSSRKKLRDAGNRVIIAKKAILQRVFENDPKLSKFVKACETSVALVLSNQSPYELNQFFRSAKKKMAAKVGQIAPYEIVVPAGETDLPPGPALSDLKNAGINAQIKAGKIAVGKDSTVAKAGEAINLQKTKALQILGIKPFEKTINVVYAYDGEYIYDASLLNIGAKEINEGLLLAYSQGNNISLNARFPSKSTMKVMLTMALLQGKNFAVGGRLYSKESIGQLLSLASRQGSALVGLKR